MAIHFLLNSLEILLQFSIRGQLAKKALNLNFTKMGFKYSLLQKWLKKKIYADISQLSLFE